MPDVSAVDFERMRNGGQISSVRVQPTGTAVTGYQIPLGNRPSFRDVGVVGASAWSDRSSRGETWTKTSVSTTSPRQIVTFEGKKGDIDKTFELGDEFRAATLNTAKWANGVGVALDGENLIITPTTSVNLAGLFTVQQFTAPYEIIVRAKCTATAAAYVQFGFHLHNQSASAFVGPANGYRVNESDTGTHGVNIQKYSGGWTNLSQVSGTVPINNWYRFRAQAKTTGILAETLSDTRTSLAVGTTTDTTYTAGYLVLMSYGTGTLPTLYDYVAMREFVTNEPLAGTAQPSALNRSMCQSISLADGLRACCAV